MNQDSATPTPPARSLPGRVFDFFSGFGLATTLILLLGVLTWLATLEQVDRGLYDTLNKYFDWKAWYLFPEIGGRTFYFPLPGGYWVCALLLLNLALGGVVRARKGWKHAGVLISHFGILIMLVAGGVTQHFSERGHLAVDRQANSAHNESGEGAQGDRALLASLTHRFHQFRGDLRVTLKDLEEPRGRSIGCLPAIWQLPCPHRSSTPTKQVGEHLL